MAFLQGECRLDGPLFQRPRHEGDYSSMVVILGPRGSEELRLAGLTATYPMIEVLPGNQVLVVAPRCRRYLLLSGVMLALFSHTFAPLILAEERFLHFQVRQDSPIGRERNSDVSPTEGMRYVVRAIFPCSVSSRFSPSLRIKPRFTSCSTWRKNASLDGLMSRPLC